MIWYCVEDDKIMKLEADHEPMMVTHGWGWRKTPAEAWKVILDRQFDTVMQKEVELANARRKFKRLEKLAEMSCPQCEGM